MKFSTNVNMSKETKDGRTINTDIHFNIEMDIKEMSQATMLCREDISSFIKFVKSGEFKEFISDITNAEFTEKQLRVDRLHDLEAHKEMLRKKHSEESLIVLPEQIEAFVGSFNILSDELKLEFFTRMGTSPLGDSQREHKIQVYYLYKSDPIYAAEVLQELALSCCDKKTK